MIDESYGLIIKSLTKKKQEEYTVYKEEKHRE